MRETDECYGCGVCPECIERTEAHYQDASAGDRPSRLARHAMWRAEAALAECVRLREALRGMLEAFEHEPDQFKWQAECVARAKAALSPLPRA